MFTGLIEEIGTLKSIKRSSKSARLTIAAQKVLEETRIGDSISCDGICLTVTDMNDASFTVDTMHETLERSTFAAARPGGKVNLERALKASDRLGGHIVAGHVDGTGRINAVWKDDIASWVEIETEEALMRYIVDKGSIAVDGISLTVAEAKASSFTVSIIPHTKDETTLLSKRQGDYVNLECDIVGKYVERLVKPYKGSTLDQTLKKHGYR